MSVIMLLVSAAFAHPSPPVIVLTAFPLVAVAVTVTPGSVGTLAVGVYDGRLVTAPPEEIDGGGHARSTRGRAWHDRRLSGKPRSGLLARRSLGYPDEPSSSRPCDSPHLLRAQSTPSVLRRTVAATVITRRTGGQVITY